jgi:membrane protein DedA with SNARE-associated domain
MSVLDGIAAAAVGIVDSVGYAGLAVVMFAESVLPIPSEVVLPIVGLQVSSGQLLFWAATLAATVGSVLGAWLLYAVGRLGGRPIARRLPRFLGVTEVRLARMESWFAARGNLVVLVGRLVPGVRSVVSIPAGTLRMPVGRFLVLTAVGSFGWNAALIGFGTALATRWQAALAAVSAGATYVLPATVASAAAMLLVLVLRRARALALRP